MMNSNDVTLSLLFHINWGLLSKILINNILTNENSNFAVLWSCPRYRGDSDSQRKLYIKHNQSTILWARGAQSGDWEANEQLVVPVVEQYMELPNISRHMVPKWVLFRIESFGPSRKKPVQLDLLHSASPWYLAPRWFVGASARAQPQNRNLRSHNL